MKNRDKDYYDSMDFGYIDTAKKKNPLDLIYVYVDKINLVPTSKVKNTEDRIRIETQERIKRMIKNKIIKLKGGKRKNGNNKRSVQ